MTERSSAMKFKRGVSTKETLIENVGEKMKKKEKISGCVWIFIALVLQTFTPAVFKQASLATDINNLPQMFTNAFLIIGVILFCSRFIAWQVVLRTFPLSVAHPVMSLSFITILVLGVVWFRETVTIGNIFGSFFIIFGVFLNSQAGKKTMEVNRK